MRILVGALVALMGIGALASSASADHRWHGHYRDRVYVERVSPTLGIGAAAALAIILAEQARKQETYVEPSPRREYTPLK
jgi:hypothetical protein